jgi:hypothetical protein
MDEGRFIRCRNCGAIHHVTSFDRSPVFNFIGGDVQEIAANDWRDFMTRHTGHKLEPLSYTGNDYFANGAVFDPMSVAYVEVTNGEETLLLRRSRARIDEPLTYEIVRGQIVQNETTLDVQEAAIRKEMKLHFSWSPAAPLEDCQITLFVELFREVVREIDPRTLRAGEYFYADAQTSYYPIDEVTVDALMARCGGRFLPSELEALRRFVDTHRDASDVMALMKRRNISVAQPTE